MSSRTGVIAALVTAIAIAVAVTVVVVSGMDHDNHNNSSGGNTDGAFITGMVPHHQSAVQMAGLALEKAEHPELKELAQAIVSTQTEEIDQLTAAYERIFDEPLPGFQYCGSRFFQIHGVLNLLSLAVL